MFHVRPDVGEPMYAQLVRQLRQAVATGALARGAQLPSIRQLASELDGVPGRGWFVTNGRSPRLREAERRRRIHELVDQLWAEGRSLGYESEEVEAIVVEALSRRVEAERHG
jgi:DNA-binding transcriptional regulator YhcF (GntR family)